MLNFDFNYNVATKTVNHIKNIDYTYHINNTDYRIMHSHIKYWEFTIVTEGEIINYRNGKKEVIPKNTLFISTTEDSHYFKSDKGKNLTIVNIIGRSEKVEELFEKLYPGVFNELLHGNKIYALPKEILDIINGNLKKVNSLPESKWVTANNILRSTIISIISFIYLENLNISGSSEEWEKKLNRLKGNDDFISYKVNDLCQSLGYSRTQLNRLFETAYKMSPHDYLVNYKMDYAASLLAYTNETVSDIANRLGYSNLSQFINNFKNYYNETPKRYRIKSNNIINQNH